MSTSFRETAFTDAPAKRATKKRGALARFLMGPEVAQDDLTPFTARGSRLRTGSARARAGYYAPAPEGAPTTTRQAEILNTAVVGAPTGIQGIVHGVDLLSKTMVVHEPFTAYNEGLISSTNTIVTGDVGSGKSGKLKTCYLLRPLLLRDRRVVVFDKKTLRGEAEGDVAGREQGEYAELARTIGSEPLTFDAAGSTRLNLLDPSVLGLSGGTSRQIRLLQTVAGLARGGATLDTWEARALRSAYYMTLRDAEQRGRVPVLGDLARLLGHVLSDDAHADLEQAAKDRLHEASVGVRFVFENLMDEYGAVLDGETSAHVDLGGGQEGGRLTVFDLSQLPDDGPGVSILMAVANMWLLARLRHDHDMKTYQIVEEGWHVLDGPSAAFLRYNTKIQRSLGLALVIALHKLAEIPEHSPAAAVLQEAQTVEVFRTTRVADIERTVQTLSLHLHTAAELDSLPNGTSIMKIGARPEFKVRNPLSGFERRLIDTDRAMRERTA